MPYFYTRPVSPRASRREAHPRCRPTTLAAYRFQNRPSAIAGWEAPSASSTRRDGLAFGYVLNRHASINAAASRQAALIDAAYRSLGEPSATGAWPGERVHRALEVAQSDSAGIRGRTRTGS
jgi:hypothetical protein